MKNTLLFLLISVSFCFACGAPSSSSDRTSLVQSTIAAPKNEPPAAQRKANTAIVISPPANLRESARVSAAVLEVVPQDSAVEVIKQKGAWFLVKTDSLQGWMHGNTIKLQSFEIASPKLPPVVRRTPEPELEINNSGATAKCRDGSLSYSRNRRGTCSHHGGVAVWY